MNFQRKWSYGFALTLSVSFALTSVTLAGVPKEKANAEIEKVAGIEVPAYSNDWDFNAAVENSLKTQNNIGNRAIASATWTETDFSKKFQDFRSDFNKLQTADQLETKLNDLQRDYNSYDANMKYVVAQLLLLKPYRGIVYRVTKLFEANGVSRSMAVSMIRGVATDLNIFLPLGQWKAGFDYITAPSPDPAQDGQFTSVAELQAYMLKTIYPTVGIAIGNLQNLLVGYKAPILWDKQLVYGPKAFKNDNLNRFRVVTPAELNRVISSLHITMYGFKSFCAYNFNDLFIVANNEYAAREFDVAKGKTINHYDHSKRQRTAGLTTSYMTIWPKSGRTLMQDSWTHLTQALNFLNEAFKGVSDGSDVAVAGDYSFLPASKIMPHEHAVNSQLKKWMEMTTNGSAEFHNVVTGEVAHVNLKAFFYDDAPGDLKIFWPTSWNDAANPPPVINKNGKPLSYRNYFRGQGATWHEDVYRKYISVEGGGNPNTALRIISQAWGGAPLVMPLRLALE